ncbi:peptidase inhibitor family I36 protein [Streptomyces sp. CB03238]|uniref:peptidase inhibitor family I36 protein n=1 Tax=Streptomyces sp. CB03238 TaxID=1907777 RepID=UPI000A122570|nr:peptidase inhibitor family I36 protein [Streptomyces sp. CB03238]ORT61735.1 hypothetical protein BKD26_01530 [Streptomyces sp. CB03238]
MALRKLTAALVAVMALLATTLGLSATATAATGGGDRQDATVRAVTTDPGDDGKDDGKDGKDDDGRGNVLKNARADCPAQHFCMFTGTNFTGAQFNLYRCGTYALENWTGNGSWINNQTPGTRARFLDRNRNTIFTTPGAYSASAGHNWNPVWYVVPC